MQRGWVLQERLLSRRSVYFGEPLYWECSSRLACELFLDHVPQDHPFVEPGVGSPFRISTILHGQHLQGFNRQTMSGNYNDRYWGWKDIVLSFTKCQPTNEEDYVPALSGLAHDFKVATGHEYHARVWRGDMPWGLLWYHWSSCGYSRTGPIRPKQYRGRTYIPCKKTLD